MVDILETTQSGLESVPTFMNVVKDIYLHAIIDYKILTPSSRFYIETRRWGSILSSYYFRASILSPYLIYSLNLSLLHGKRIFTPTLGWSSYLYGFACCPEVLEYVGTDVIPEVCDKTRALASTYFPKLKTTIFCKPSEDLYKTASFLKKYQQHFDTVFFSPPYYRLELYKGGDQSTDRYKTYEEWLHGYWEPTIQLCYHVLAPEGRMCYILSGYGSNNTEGKYNLIEDMNRISTQYFRLQSKQPMYNKNVNVTKHRETNEQIMVFTKG
jgi:hypothetical protein